MNGGDGGGGVGGGNGGGEVSGVGVTSPAPLEWKFSQVFGERAAGEEVQEGLLENNYDGVQSFQSNKSPIHHENWELVLDKGFVYHKKKRRLDLEALVPAPDPAPDPAAEMKERKKRKRNALIALKNKWLKELSLWEHLSNMLKAMEETTKLRDLQRDEEKREGELQQQTGVSVGNHSGCLLNELFLQVEAQEAIIGDFSNICDVAESLCNVSKEKAKLQFIDLPVWNSPRELMASLCED